MFVQFRCFPLVARTSQAHLAGSPPVVFDVLRAAPRVLPGLHLQAGKAHQADGSCPQVCFDRYACSVFPADRDELWSIVSFAPRWSSEGPAGRVSHLHEEASALFP